MITDEKIEVILREWWPYPAPPGTHAVMTHVGFARHILSVVNRDVNLQLRQVMTAKAHLLGAQDDPESRRQYFRTLADIDHLAGIADSPFERLG